MTGYVTGFFATLLPLPLRGGGLRVVLEAETGVGEGDLFVAEEEVIERGWSMMRRLVNCFPNVSAWIWMWNCSRRQSPIPGPPGTPA